MEQNKTLNMDASKIDLPRLDSIMLRPTRTGRGFKVVHNGIWYFASRQKVLDVINQKLDKCTFVTIEDEVTPAQ